jgi:hypothetical protein
MIGAHAYESAALMLLKPEWFWRVTYCEGLFCIDLSVLRDDDDEPVNIDAKTFALAITAAALKAHAAKEVR